MKKLLCLVSFILLMSLCCGHLNKDDVNQIKFATWGSKSEIEIIKPIIEEYNRSHDIKVELVHIPQNYFQKIHLLFASNLAPDVIFINNLYLKIYQKANLLEDLTEFIDKGDYFENALLTLSVDGKIYAVPRDVSSFVVFYNKNVFKKAGVKPNSKWSIDDFYSVSAILKKYSEYGFCTEFESAYWENFVSTSNKPVIYNDKVTANEKKSIIAIQTLADKINKEKLGVNKEQLALSPCAQMFLNQKTAMFISGRWSVPKINSQSDFDYGILPFPDGGSEFYIPINASGWGIYKNSKNKSAAINFVNFMASDENISKLSRTGLITPAKKSVAFSENFQNGEVFLSVIEKSTPNIVSADYNTIIDKLNLSVLSVLGGYKKAEDIFGKLLIK